MSWADRTFWVKRQPQNEADYAIASEASLEELHGILDMDPEKNTLEPARDSAPCRDCPQQNSCMDSIWVDGKRMSGPPTGAASFSDVVECHYCLGPMLILYQIGPSKPVPNNCPRRTAKIGNCDACQKLRSRLAEMPYPPAELRDVVREILEVALTDPDLAPTWDQVPKVQRVDLFHKWTGLLCDAVCRDFEPETITRAMVLEMSDGPLEKAWLAKAQPARKFIIRCWEGLVRHAVTL